MTLVDHLKALFEMVIFKFVTFKIIMMMMMKMCDGPIFVFDHLPIVRSFSFSILHRYPCFIIRRVFLIIVIHIQK